MSLNRISEDLKNTGVIKSEEKRFDFKFTPTESYKIEEPKENIYDIAKSNSIEEVSNRIKEINEEKNVNTLNNTSAYEEKIIDYTFNKDEEISIDRPRVNNVDNTPFEEEKEVKTNNEILYKYIGNVFNTYIIIQINEKMYIIDQHAAH